MYAVKKGCFFTVSVVLSGGNCLLSNIKDCSRKGDVTFVSLLPPVVKTCFNSNVNHTFIKFSFLPGPSNYNGMAVFDCVPAQGVIGPGTRIKCEHFTKLNN